MALPLAVTMGEPAGIGGEIALKAWLGLRGDLPPFYLIDDPDRLASLARRLDWPVPIRPIDAPDRAPSVFADALPVLPIDTAIRARPGRPDPSDAPAILGAIQTAVRDVRNGRAAALVTNPIHKESLYRAGFHHPGHTEYLAELAGCDLAPIMMLVCPGLRVVPVTIHLALRRAVESLSSATIVEAGRITEAALRRDFGLSAPLVAVAGLNPHAGEGGSLGREEIEIIEPAVAQLRAGGIDVVHRRRLGMTEEVDVGQAEGVDLIAALGELLRQPLLLRRLLPAQAAELDHAAQERGLIIEIPVDCRAQAFDDVVRQRHCVCSHLSPPVHISNRQCL